MEVRDESPVVGKVEVVNPFLDAGFRHAGVLALEGPAGVDHQARAGLVEGSRQVVR